MGDRYRYLSPSSPSRWGQVPVPVPNLLNRGNIDFYMAFNMFRLAAIVHGIKGRLVRGTASSGHAAQMAASLEPLAERAWEQAVRAGA